MRDFMKNWSGRCFVLTASLLLTLSVWAQSPGKVTLQAKGSSLLQALQQIKSQTNAKFIYSDSELQQASPVTIELNNVTLEEALNRLMMNVPFIYERGKDNVYIIKPLPATVTKGNMKTISGKVVDARNGEPLAGATIFDARSKMGCVTTNEGSFTLDVPSNCRSLSISYIGYVGKNVAVSRQALTVTLEESAQTLNDVVVVGYGSTQRKDLTGSVSTVKTEELRALPSTTIDDALAGKAAGVQVTKADGSPGGAVRIRVRGGASLQGNADPLYIIDGIPTEINNNYIASGDLNNPIEWGGYGEQEMGSISGSFARGLNCLSGLNLNDIESITILKDASATAIYGSKAANGVVIITTKRGQHDTKPTFNFNYYMSVTTPVKEKVLNGEQYLTALRNSLELSNRNMIANGLEGNRYFVSNSQKLAELSTYGNANTDWLDMVLRTGVAHNADISVSGGGNRSRYYTSFSYTKQDGTLIGTDFERYTGKMTLDNDVTNRFHVYTNLNLGYTKNNITNGLYGQALSAPPILPAYNEDGTYASYDAIGGVGYSYVGYQNPMAIASCTNEAKTYTFKGSVSGTIDIWDELKFKSMVSINWQNYNQLNYIPSYVNVSSFYGATDSEGGQGTQAQSITTDVFFENTLSYNKTFNENHRLDAVLGTSWEDQRTSYFSASGKGYPDDQFLNGLSSAQIAASVAGANPKSQTSLLSFYLRANYVLMERYLFTFTGRSDASSKFSKSHRVGYFPSGAIAWRISEEPFLKNVSWIDEIKLRGSMGKTGTQHISDHMFLTLFSPGAYAGSNAMYPSQLGNDDIRWESTKQKDLGLDFSFFKGRLSGTLAYYHKITDGALLNVTPAPSSGFSTVVTNIAKVRNTGLEFELYGDIIRTKDWRWSASLNIAHNGSKVLDIMGDQFSSSTDRNALNLGTSLIKEGESLGLLCGRKAVGIIHNQAELDDYKSRFSGWSSFFPDLGIGSIEFALDENGSWYEDVIGNSTPDFYGGFATSLAYKNWSLSANFTYSYGNDLIYQKDVTDAGFNSMANRGVRVLEASTPEHITGKQASTYASVYFLTNLNVYDASYLKLNSLNLTYNLPAKLIKKYHLNNLAIYATATNLFTITSYPSPDPAVSDDPYSISGGGRDISSYPTTRSYTLGLRIGF